MTTLLVGIWSVETCGVKDSDWMSKSLDFKLIALNQALAAFARFRSIHKNLITGSDDKVRAIFVTPEYFLAQRTSTQGLGYINGLTSTGLGQRISNQRNLLVVPGTVASRKPVTVERRLKYSTGINALEEAPERYATGVATESKTGFIRNTAYGFLHGLKRIKCRKQADATDGVTKDDPDAFVPGWGTNKARLPVPHTVEPRLLSFGIEICADASNQRAGTKGYLDATDEAPVDVKIVVSAYLESRHVYTGNYNYCLIHAASNGLHSGVTVRGGARVTQNQKQTFLGYPLDYYTVTIP